MGSCAPGSVSTIVLDWGGVLPAFITICWIFQAGIVLSHMGQPYSANIDWFARFLFYDKIQKTYNLCSKGNIPKKNCCSWILSKIMRAPPSHHLTVILIWMPPFDENIYTKTQVLKLGPWDWSLVWSGLVWSGLVWCGWPIDCSGWDTWYPWIPCSPKI